MEFLKIRTTLGYFYILIELNISINMNEFLVSNIHKKKKKT